MLTGGVTVEQPGEQPLTTLPQRLLRAVVGTGDESVDRGRERCQYLAHVRLLGRLRNSHSLSGSRPPRQLVPPHCQNDPGDGAVR